MTTKNIFSGQSKIVLFDDAAPITFTPYCGDDVTDSPLLVDEMGEPITPTLSFSFDCDDDQIKEFMTKPDPDMQGNFICSVSIGEKEYIYRPHNLKYPNKKRAKRIWKKWKKRYGSRNSAKIFIPRARITPTIEGASIECLTPNQ